MERSATLALLSTCCGQALDQTTLFAISNHHSLSTDCAPQRRPYWQACITIAADDTTMLDAIAVYNFLKMLLIAINVSGTFCLTNYDKLVKMFTFLSGIKSSSQGDLLWSSTEPCEISLRISSS